jgi:two-component system, LuxR family, response regulator FixJ
VADLKAHIIDDDDDARESLAFLAATADIPVDTYVSAGDFLLVAAQARGVVVTDVRMPEMDGLELVQRLNELKIDLPVIVMTGHGDIALAVEAMKAGVVDFIEKPYDNEVMLRAIREALDRAGRTLVESGERAEYRRRLGTLSTREREVLQGLVAGKPNKVIAFELAISPRTVEIYRAKVMTKMSARSLSELVRMFLAVGDTRS